MLEKKNIQDLFRRLELAAQESDQAAQEARAQLALAQSAEEVVLRSDAL